MTPTRPRKMGKNFDAISGDMIRDFACQWQTDFANLSFAPFYMIYGINAISQKMVKSSSRANSILLQDIM